MSNKKLAIIGASTGQYELCLKAHELGIETHCFAYEKGAICKDIVDHFYPISIYECDQIVSICRELGIDGVLSNASDKTSEVVSYVAEHLNLTAPSLEVLRSLHDKYHVRSLTDKVEGLLSPRFYRYEGVDKGLYPCVVKPCLGGGKRGVSFVSNASEFAEAIAYANPESQDTVEILVEEYVTGKELSIECLSYRGHHYVIQITDKDSSSAPHFVELGHHQPAEISTELQSKIHRVIPQLLDALGYDNGASHIEVKYKDSDLYLIEANLRGGGDHISNKLVYMSSGIDYLKCMIDVALDDFSAPQQTAPSHYAGIYYLCAQTADLLPFFQAAKGKEWVKELEIYSTELQESHSNYERNGYLLYQSDHKIIP